MTDDIVTRLQDAWHNGDQDAAIGLAQEAADSLEARDAYEEALDLAIYLRGVMYERDNNGKA